MVTPHVTADKLILEIEGMDKLWTFHSRLEIPLAHVKSVRHEDQAQFDRDGWVWRMGGTAIPGLITAGTYLQKGRWLFWDVHDATKAIVIELHDEHYSELVVEVENPEASVSAISAAIDRTA